MGLFRTYGGAKAYKRVIRNTLISLLLLLLASFVFFLYIIWLYHPLDLLQKPEVPAIH